MVDEFEKIRTTIVSGLKKYVGHPVIRANQIANVPEYPYSSYTVTTLMGENNGTYEEYEDGVNRKTFEQIWSITTQSDNYGESVTNAMRAREWFERVGLLYLSEHKIIVQRVGPVTNRDNFLTTEFEYRHGFDVVFTLDDVIFSDNSFDEGDITLIQIGETDSAVPAPLTMDELNAMLEKRLDGE